MLWVEIQNCFNSGSVGGTCGGTSAGHWEGLWGRCRDQSIDVHCGLTHFHAPGPLKRAKPHHLAFPHTHISTVIRKKRLFKVRTVKNQTLIIEVCHFRLAWKFMAGPPYSSVGCVNCRRRKIKVILTLVHLGTASTYYQFLV